jgi:PKD repeat protein
MIPTTGYALLASIFTGESSDTITKLQIGYGYTDELLTDSALEHAYTDLGFEQVTLTGSYTSPVLTFTHTFTNNSTVERPVREVGLFSNAGVLLDRWVFSDLYLPNWCIVPPGKSIAITVTLTFSDSAIVFTPGTTHDATIAFNIYITPAETASLDITTFSAPSAICYNGIPIRNAGIPSFSENYGAKTWGFSCHTEDYTDVENILRYAGPVQTGISITGKQYAISAFRSGILAIMDIETPTTHTYYQNCYVVGPIVVTPFGDGWDFTVNVIQSAYPEVIT